MRTLVRQFLRLLTPSTLPVLAGALVLAGCGGGDAAEPTTIPSETATPTAPTTAAAPTSGVSPMNAIGVDSATGASIETSKDDYLPGEVVHLVLKGWGASEDVRLYMTEEPDTHGPVDTTITVDENGEWAGHFYDVQEHDFGSTFTLTATGLTSGSSATVVFYDGAPILNSFTLNGTTFTFGSGGGNPPATNPITVTAGSSVTIAVNATTVQGGGANSPATWKSTQVALKADGDFVVAVCDETNVVDPGQVTTTTHSFSFTAPAASTTKYDVRVRAYEGDGCTGNQGSKTYDDVMQVNAAPATGTITIVKDAAPNSAQDFAFTTTGTGLGNFSLDDDADPTLSNTTTFSNLSPGSFTVTESAASGWDLTNLTCTGGGANTTTNAPTRTASIGLDAGETVTCTFTNTQGASITIVKNALPDDAQDFGFTTTGTGLAGFSLDDDADGTLSNTTTFNVLPGTFTVTESAVSGWDLVNLECTGGGANTTPSTATRTASIGLDAGENVTCTFTNVKRGSIIVEKQTTPDGAAGSFTFTGTAAGSISDNGTITVANLTPGTYTSTESDPGPAFALASISCDDGSSTTPSTFNVGTRTATFEVDAGETVKCTFTNRLLPNLTITKTPVAGACDDGTGDTDFCFGAQATYTLQVSNSGGATSGTVQVTDTLPALLDYVNSTTAAWTCAASLDQTVGLEERDIVVCSTDDVIAGSGGTKDLTLKVMPKGAGNDVVNRASVIGGGDLSSASSSNATVDVKPAATTTTVAVSPTTQQYSDSVVFTATVSPAKVLTEELTGGVVFTVEGVAFASTAVTCDYVGANTCTATLRYKVVNASNDPVSASAAFTSTNANFGGSSSSTDATVTVTREDATIYDFAASPDQILSGGTTTLTFKVRETNPEKNNPLTLVAAGDLGNIPSVTLSLKGVLYGGNIGVNCVLGAVQGTGYGQYRVATCPSGALPADTYEAEATVNGLYYTGSNSIVVQVTDPAQGFATGGGWYEWNGDRVNFGFMAKSTVNNRKVVYQGALLTIRHKANGDVVKVKSNVFDGYSIKGTEVTFTGKANYSVNGYSEGNFAFTGYGNDLGTPGANTDKFGLYLAKAGNEVGTSTTVLGLPGSAVVIKGGNIQVPQPSRTAK